MPGQSANFWAVSQAVSMRRVQTSGANLSLMDYCTAGPQFASGGFIADSNLPFTINGSQQQWLIRNSQVAGWSNGVWNQVFSGVVGAPDDAGFPDPPYTTIDETPVSREKPYLFVDDEGRYNVRVPSAQTDSSGTSWGAHATAGRSIPITEFFIATPADSVKDINNALARGQNLIFTPGIYNIDRTIDVKRADTVVLGMGHATLTSVGGAVPIDVKDAAGHRHRGNHDRRGHDALTGAHEDRQRERRQEARREQPDHPERRLLPRRRAGHRQDRPPRLRSTPMTC